jgi:hypothetical protein
MNRRVAPRCCRVWSRTATRPESVPVTEAASRLGWTTQPPFAVHTASVRRCLHVLYRLASGGFAATVSSRASAAAGIRFKIIALGSRARRRNVRAMTQQAPHQHSYTIPLEWESRVPIVTTVRTIEMTRSHSTDKPSSWVTSATRVTVVGCECGATYRRDLPL